MKAWTISELDNVISALKPLIGARLQEIQTSDQDLILGFYSSQGMLWLWIDLSGTAPCLLPWQELPLHVPQRKNPLNLFLRAHYVGKPLHKVVRPDNAGRVVRLYFADFELELRLFAQGRNIIAKANDKKISWHKPKDLAESPSQTQHKNIGLRSLEELRQEWLATRKGKGRAKTTKEVKNRIQNDIEKKQKAFLKIKEDLKRKQELPWREVGDWIKANQSLEVSKEWEPYIDRRRKLAWNIEECFKRARENDSKAAGTEQRLRILEAEIKKLSDRQAQPLDLHALEKPKIQPLQDSNVKARTLRISDEISVISGKSAADNLALLRRARAWDLWFHLKDYPSSHAILFRNKNTPVGEGVVQQALEWYVKQVFGAKLKEQSGVKVHVLMAECRYVRPVKGDKLGRVTYHNERQMIYQIT